MGSFVNPKETVDIEEFDPDVIISDVTPRVITIRAKMDYATQKQVQGTAWKMGAGGKGTELNFGDSLMELLIRNILSWRGGDLEGVPCDAAHIKMLDPTDPFIDRVADEIGKRNTAKPSPNLTTPIEANTFMSDGSTASSIPREEGASLSRQLATSTPKSSLRSVLDGHIGKSENTIPST